MLNKVIIMGRLCFDPELRQTGNGTSLCHIRVAVNRPYRKDRESQTDFINVTLWNQNAEFVSRNFSKGKMIIVEGKLQNNDYTDRNGVKHNSMVVVADNVQFGESKNAGSDQRGYAQQQYQNHQNNGYQQGNDYPPQNNDSNQNYGYGSGMNQQNYQQQYSAPPPQGDGLGSADDFQDIFSDGEVPF